MIKNLPAPGWEGSLERMDTCICMAESLHCSLQTITTLLMDYTPIQNKKLKKKESSCQCRGHRFNPWSGKIPHAAGQPSPCVIATEAHVPRTHALKHEKT